MSYPNQASHKTLTVLFMSAISSVRFASHSATLFGVGFVPSSARRSFNAACASSDASSASYAKISVLGRMSEIFLLTFVLLSASRSTLPCNVGKGKSAGNPQTMGKPNFCFRLQASFGLSSHKGSCRSIQTLLRIYHISFSFSNLFSSSSTSYRQWTRSLFALTSIPSCSAHCQGMLFRLSL